MEFVADNQPAERVPEMVTGKTPSVPSWRHLVIRSRGGGREEGGYKTISGRPEAVSYADLSNYMLHRELQFGRDLGSMFESPSLNSVYLQSLRQTA